VTSLHRFSVAAPRSEGPHLTLRHGPARQAYSDYTHYYPRRADGMAGVLLQCISPLCCPRYLPLDQSATIRNLCTYPSQMRPLSTPPEHKTPQNATSRRDKPACCRARDPQAYRPSHPIRTLPSPPSSRNICTAAVASSAPMGVGRVSSGRRGGRRLAGEGRRRHNPAQNEGQSCDDDQFETIDTPGDDGETRHQKRYCWRSRKSAWVDAECPPNTVGCRLVNPREVTSLSVSKVRMTQVRAHAPCAPPSGRRWSRRLDHPAPVSVAQRLLKETCMLW
jgi:hypothetical protein